MEKNGIPYVVWSFYSAVSRAPSLFAKLLICAVPEEYFIIPEVKERFLRILTWSFNLAWGRLMPTTDWNNEPWDNSVPENQHRIA